MFATRALTRQAFGQPVRNMATLSDIKRRLRGVNNMKKITSAMKMVAASKLRVAERQLHPARKFGEATERLTNMVEERPEVKKHLILAVTTDRGLCGGVNTQISKEVKRIMAEDNEKNIEFKLCMIGDKGRQQLGRQYADSFLAVYNDFGRTVFSHAQASYIADDLLSLGYEFDELTVVHNKYRSAIAFDTVRLPCVSSNGMKELAKSKLVAYQPEGESDLVENYQSHHLANMIYTAFSENYTVEQSSRMNAMDGASGNASDMIEKLQLTYNRTRQAVITRELIEIISGASAL